MNPHVRNLFDLTGLTASERPNPLILVNGLAEQSESWFANRRQLARHFEVKVPEILVYDGDSLHRHIDAGGEVTVDYLADRLGTYLDEFVQRPPYHLVGSSLGGQICLTLAVRNPELVSKLVLIAPSGLHGDETLPMMDGVRRSDYDSLVNSVFHRRSHSASDTLVGALEQKFQSRKWKKGVLRTLRGTVGHSVSGLLERVPHPTLLIWGSDDRVISDVAGSIRAADRLISGRQVVIPKCGHAPQIEKSRLVNTLITRFLRDRLKAVPPMLDPARFLDKDARRPRPGSAPPGFEPPEIPPLERPTMSDFSLFFGKFLKHGTRIASVAPSSPWLSRATVGNVEWSTARVIVELGAGTGPITRVIAERASPETKVVVLERDADFAAILRERFAGLPHFDVIEGDVRDLSAMLLDRGLDRVDHVISGLPVPSFPKDLRRDLFRVVKNVLEPSGTYNQITEIPWVYQGLYRKFFDEVRFVFEPRNFPPAGAYYCRRPKETA